MNDLNSVLIEGTVLSGVQAFKEKDTECCFLFISNQRSFNSCFKDTKRIERQETCVSIVLRGSKQVEVAKTKAKNGCRVRVVGRLVEGDGGLYVEAEHIEYRLSLKTEDNIDARKEKA